MAGNGYAQSLVDPELTIDPDWTLERETEIQAERLLALGASVLHMTSLKRRLGGDANQDELRDDLRTSKRVLTRVVTAARNWGVEQADIEERYQTELTGHTAGSPSEVIVAGAQRDWAEFWADYKVWMQNRVRYVATHALKLTDKKTANRTVHRFELEFNMVKDILDPEL